MTFDNPLNGDTPLPLGVRKIVPGDDGWPSAVDELIDPPKVLYVRGGGDLGALMAKGTVAVVGTRNCTTYGAEVASDLGADVASALDPATVVSDGSYGISGAALRGALAHEQPTIVVAVSAVVTYPRAHDSLFDRAREAGVIVSEDISGVVPNKSSFARRDLLLAALCDKLVVVEAGAMSSVMATARLARQMGRGVYAVPGPVTSQASSGPHALIAEGIATILPSTNLLA